MRLNIKFDQYYLDNGLRVLLHEDHSVPIVAINLWYHVGSKNEDAGRTGFAHLFEHMMFQGSEHVPENDHFRLVQEAGGVLNGSTGFDRTNYYETLPANFLELGLWLESDRMGYLLPAMDQAKLDNQRSVVKNERRQTVENRPYGLWFETILELAYPNDYPYHWPVIGYMKHLDAATLDDVKTFFRTWYAPDNATLVLAGDFNRQESVDLIRGYFGQLPKGLPRAKMNHHFNDFFHGEKRKVLYDDVQLPRLHMAYHIPGLKDVSFHSGELLTDVFSHGRSSRLYHAMVYRDQLVQDVSAFVMPMEETSLLVFIATPRPGISIEETEAAIEKEIAAIIESGIKEVELERIKNQVEAEKIHSMQTVESRANKLNMFATYFDEPEMINTEIDKLMALTTGQLQDYCRRFLQKKNRVVVTILPIAEKA